MASRLAWFVFLALFPAVRTAHNCQPPLQVPSNSFASTYAWSAIYNAQPSHVTAPLKGRLLPPVGLPGVCAPSLFEASAYAYHDFASIWVARPRGTSATVYALYGAKECSPGLSGITVTMRPLPQLRLQFEGCDGCHVAFAIPLTKESDDAAVHGIPVFKFMCQVDRDLCDAARRDVLQAGRTTTHPPVAVNMEFTSTLTGVGRCNSTGTQPTPETTVDPTSEDGCAAKCGRRIDENMVNPTMLSCKGYAWNPNPDPNISVTKCILYDGWQIDSSDDLAGWKCVSMSHKTAAQIAENSPTEAPVAVMKPTQKEEVKLDLSPYFNEGLVARRTAVSPFIKDCFDKFEWIVAERKIAVDPADWNVMLEMTKAAAVEDNFAVPTAANVTSDVLAAPRADIVVESVCLRTCAGDLSPQECEAKDTSFNRHAYLIAKSHAERGEQVHGSPVKPAVAAHASGKGAHDALVTYVGDDTAEALTDDHFLPWLILLCLLFFLLGLLLACCIGWMCRKTKGNGQEYAPVQSVQLIYETEDGEQEAARVEFRTTPGGAWDSTISPVLNTQSASQGPFASAFATAFGSTR